jgi:PhoH-like ATPase
MQNEKNVKTFVIDTNVFIHRPDALLSFRDNEIVIPLWVLEELDHLKTLSDERGRNARHSIRFLDECSKHGNLSEGVKLENGSTLRVALQHGKFVPDDLLSEKPDNKIILTAYALQKEGRQVFFVSKDINARVKATSLGIKAVDYEKQKVNIETLYAGYTETDSTAENIKNLKNIGTIAWPPSGLQPNQFVVLCDKKAGNRQIGRFRPEDASLDFLEEDIGNVCGVKPRNEIQRMAFDLLLDESIPIVTLMGKAGTGKTLLAIAAGLKMVLEEKNYSRVLVSRPIIPLGKDIGYLPGGKDQKLSHWMQPFFDNLEYILSVYKRQNLKSVDQLINNKIIELEALTYIRGRSLPEQFIIIDEAQNLSPHEIKTIVSRAGEGTKVVLTGDPYQIDSPYLDSSSNGLSYLVDSFKGQKLFGHVTLHKSERSELADLAAEIL